MTAARMYDSPVVEVSKKSLFSRYFFVPHEELNEILKACIGHACAETDVKIIGGSWMINHHHFILYSPGREASDWMQTLHSMVALLLKKLYDLPEGWVWCRSSPYTANVYSMRQLMVRIVYTTCNPIAAGVARSHEEYLGLTLKSSSESRTLESRRPDEHFNARTRVAEETKIPMMGLRDLVAVFRALADRDGMAWTGFEANRRPQHADNTLTKDLTEDGETDAATEEKEEEEPTEEEIEMMAIDELLRSLWSAQDPENVDWHELLHRAIEARSAHHRKVWKQQGKTIPTPKVMAKRNAKMLARKVWRHDRSESSKRKNGRKFKKRAPSYFYDSIAEKKYRERRAQAFDEMHRDSYERWLSKEKHVVFPRGTVQMRGKPNVVIDTGPPEGTLPRAL